MRTGLRRLTRRVGEELVRVGAPGRQLVLLDYPVDPAPRGQHPTLRGMLEANASNFAVTLHEVAAAISKLDGTGLPWGNLFLPPFDAATLYGIVASRQPRTYLEIGSGNSTIFVRRAIGDRSPRSTLVSIDPNPRAHIDALCDEVVRAPLEKTDRAIFAGLQEGDVVFFDGSHRAFTNSDVTVFFLEILPTLEPGVVVGIHDIYLPDDYPPDAAVRMWNEQYLLAAQLLAQGADRVLLPNFFVTHYTTLAQAALAEPWKRLGLSELHGCAFWLTT